MTRKYLAILSLGAAVLLVASCGRQPAADPNTDDGGITQYDTGVPWDGYIPNDTGNDGSKPCVPDCGKICEMQRDCGMIGPAEVAQCEQKCNADPKSPENVCLAQLACAATPDCTAAKQCKSNPTAPDLKVTHKALGGQGVITYEASVCNDGTGDAAASYVHFYRNLTAPPKPGQKGDTIAQVPALKS